MLGNRIDRLHTINIRWTRATSFNEEDLKRLRNDKECGWYIITRQFGPIETPIYVGKAKNTIYKRVLQHTPDDSYESFFERRGEKYVYIGTIENSTLNTKDKLSRRYHVNRLLLTVESALIQNIYGKFGDVICNHSQKNKYTRWYKFRIVNSNIRESILDHEIINSEHDNTIPCPIWWKGQLE